MFNFSKNVYIDLFHDTRYSENDPKVKGFFIVFLVKPDLNLGNDIDFILNDRNINDSNYASYSQQAQIGKLFKGLLNPYIRQNLTHSGGSYFSSIISNKCESVTYPDVGSNSEDTLTTLDKNVFKLPVTETGISGMNFQMRLRENEAHDALRMISVWHKYIHSITKGNLTPKNEYSEYNIIDYKASLYILHLKPDLSTITMWSKYTGIYPTNVPLSILSEDISQVTDVTIDVEFSYDRFEWMNEDLLKEINLLSSGFVISKASLEALSPEDMSKGRIPLIAKKANSPFYFIDLNGIKFFADKRSINPKDQPVGQFGAVVSDQLGTYFPAALTTEMVNASTSWSLTNDDGVVQTKTNIRF